MNRRLKVVLVFLFFLTTVFESRAQYKPENYSVKFEIKNAGFRVKGTFSGLDLKVENLTEATGIFHLDGSVLTNTLNTGNRMRDRHLMESDYFDAARYPKLSLTSKSIKKLGPTRYLGDFLVTIKNTTREITFPFRSTTRPESSVLDLAGEFKINRRDFGVGGRSLILSDSVSVLMDIHLRK